MGFQQNGKLILESEMIWRMVLDHLDPKAHPREEGGMEHLLVHTHTLTRPRLRVAFTKENVKNEP